MVSNENSFDMIFHAGNAKEQSLQALHQAREGNYSVAIEELEMAQNEINLAHQSHGDILVQVVNGEHVDIDLFFMHAQDHLNAAMTIHTLVREMIEILQERRAQM